MPYLKSALVSCGTFTEVSLRREPIYSGVEIVLIRIEISDVCAVEAHNKQHTTVYSLRIHVILSIWTNDLKFKVAVPT